MKENIQIQNLPFMFLYAENCDTQIEEPTGDYDDQNQIWNARNDDSIYHRSFTTGIFMEDRDKD